MSNKALVQRVCRLLHLSLWPTQGKSGNVIFEDQSFPLHVFAESLHAVLQPAVSVQRLLQGVLLAQDCGMLPGKCALSLTALHLSVDSSHSIFRPYTDGGKVSFHLFNVVLQRMPVGVPTGSELPAFLSRSGVLLGGLFVPSVMRARTHSGWALVGMEWHVIG